MNFDKKLTGSIDKQKEIKILKNSKYKYMNITQNILLKTMIKTTYMKILI